MARYRKRSTSDGSAASVAASPSAGAITRSALPLDQIARQLRDRRIIENQFRRKLQPEPFLQLDDEISRAGRIETHLGEGCLGGNRDRWIINGFRQLRHAPAADLSFGDFIGRQLVSPPETKSTANKTSNT